MRPEAVQLERDKYGATSPINYANQSPESNRSPCGNESSAGRGRINSFAQVCHFGVLSIHKFQTDLSTNDFKKPQLPNDLIKPTPIKPTEPLSVSATNTSDFHLIDELLQIECEILNLQDDTDEVVELKPFGQLNIKFETAFNQPELVSRRYQLNFSGQQILDPVSFVCGWRRNFTYYVDYIKRLNGFNRLSHEDKLTLAKRRLVNIAWWSHVYQSYLSGKDGLCLANGHYHPYKTDSRFSEANQM